MIHAIRTIDAHAAGEPLRLVIEGFPRPEGRSMLQKRQWLRSRHDWLRRAVILEPRGHADMYGAVLTEPIAPGSHTGVLFMHHGGYSTMCGHGIVAVTTIALERGLVDAGDGSAIVFDTPAGRVRAKAKRRGDKVESVAFENVPSFVYRPALPVRTGTREVLVDVAFGGAFYAIVDAEAVGLPLSASRLPELRQAGMAIKAAVEKAIEVVHPIDTGLGGIYGTIFTGPATGGADLRNVTIFADGAVDRSPCGTGTAAVMAVLDAMGLLATDRDFVHESLIGTVFRGRLAGRASVRDFDAIVPDIEGSAWVIGEHTFWIDDEDPLKEGFRI